MEVFRLNKRLALIWIYVCGAHVGLICYLMLQPISQPSHRAQRKAIQVQSIKLTPARQTSSVSKPQEIAILQEDATPKQAAAAVPKKPETPVPKTKAKPAKTAEAKPTKPQEKPAATKKDKPATPAAATKAKKNRLASDKIAQAKANLKKIEHQTESAASPASTMLSSTEMADEAPSYQEILAERLQALLTLPDYGEVGISLTLDRLGKVIKLTILKAASEDNRKYVEKRLPGLTLPPFGKAMGAEERHTFQLVLSN